MSKIDTKKKAEERKIVEKVFNPLKFSIENNEPLDFLISDGNHKFGVEVTRLYYNDGFGRLNNKKDYKEELERDIYVHKDDYANLKIKSTYLLIPSDNQFHFAFNKITYTKPTEEQFTDKIIERIQSKNNNENEYNNTSAEWLELVISDENRYFDDGNELSKENQQKLINAVNNSIFKTVYILSTYKGIGSLYVIGKLPEFLLERK